MRILYLDPFSGVSGDMWVGALLDLGLDFARLTHEIGKLGLAGYQLSTRRVFRGAMSALKFDVAIDGELQKEFDATPGAANAHEHSHSHDHADSHSHDHSHSHSHDHNAEGRAIRRTFRQIKTLIESSTLSARVKQGTIAAFQKLAEAEGRIHNQPPDDVSFHEVGALDSIIDFVAVNAGLELLGIDEVWCGPLALGRGGFVQCDHGLIPIPAPATLDLVKNVPLRDTPVEKELTTPTGAALVAALATKFCGQSEITIEKLGYGAGSREKQAVPNVLRAMIGSPASAASPEQDTIIELRANIDDATPEALGYLMEQLLEAGALDVSYTPIQMKKNRPASLLTVLIEPALLEKISALILTESSTFGVRYEQLLRRKLAREIVSVETAFGLVRVKIGRMNEKVVAIHPEYEDCKKLAREKGVALGAVIDSARSQFEI